MRAVALACLVVAATSCSFRHGQLSTDGATSDGTAGDGNGSGSADARDCAFSAWGTSQPITELNAGPLDARPRLSPDELTIVFYSTRNAQAERDIYVSTRTAIGQPFATPVNVTELNSSTVDRDPALTPDGLAVFFTSTRTTGNYDVWTASRTSVSAAFGTPEVVTAMNTTGLEYFTNLSSDGLTLYFASDRTTNSVGGADIWFSTRPNTATPFTTVQNLGALNSAQSDHCATVSADGREIYFSSSRGGSVELWLSTRPDPTASFGTPALVPELNFTGEEHPGAMSNDGLRFYYSNQSTGVSALYVATRTCE